jgi:clan AA aspartic protease (TIGR02281 family)
MRSCNTALAVLVAGLAVLSPGLACAETVQLKADNNGTFVVPVVLNDRITLNFVLDTGATEVSIPEDVFSTLVRAGTISKGDRLDGGQYQLADGSQSTNRRFVIRSMRVGDVELRNVNASVAPAAGPLLLGLTFLLRLQSWSMDNKRHILSINQALTNESEAAHDDPPAMQPAVATPPAVQTNPMPTATKTVNWELFDSTAAYAVYVDTISRQASSGGFLEAFAPQTEKDPTWKKWVKFYVSKVAVDCKSQKMRAEAVVWYYEDGSSYIVPTAELYTGWERYRPGTLGDKEVRIVCIQNEPLR